MNDPIILFRNDGSSDSQQELGICRKYFRTTRLRTHVPKNSLVISRYSCLPYYKELEEDLAYNGSKLLNSHQQHAYIASFNYYHDIQSYTPKTWFTIEEAYEAVKYFPLIVKGRTNTCKVWKYTYADTPDKLTEVINYLNYHPEISQQGLIFRKYEPLEIIEKSAVGGFDFVNEWRLFFLDKHLLSYDYYWSVATDEAIEKARRQNMGDMLIKACDVAKIVAKRCRFFVIDMAKTIDGSWIVIELNDGQMSGLSCNSPEILYNNLKLYLK
jgi:hypothetical protein